MADTAAECPVTWVDDHGKGHECYDDADHTGGHECGCGARVPRWMLGRIAAVLADLDRVGAPAGDIPWDIYAAGTHIDQCWRWHIDCLAARIRSTLTGEETDHG